MCSAKSGLNFYQNMKKKKDEIIDRSRRIDRLTDIQTDWAYIYEPHDLIFKFELLSGIQVV